MKRRHQSKDFSQNDHHELNKKTALHEAGHATAIYLGNKQKQLPPVFFRIFFKDLNNGFQATESLCHDHSIAVIEGGRLIHTLPGSIGEAIKDFSPSQKQSYLLAVEADIINIMAGPLAEAMYIALRDDEVINPRLVNLDALRNYGGLSDMEAVNDYLECLIACNEQRKDKATELFMSAFNFINDTQNWQAITALANYILTSPKNIISCEEVMEVIDRTMIDRLDKNPYVNPKFYLQTEPFPL
jgi:hypothetical protein